MNRQLYNNVGISALGIVFILRESKTLTLSKALLIMPFISHKSLLNYLAHSRTDIKSLDKLIIDNVSWFSNFNRRYFDSLPISFNAMQLLNEIELIKVESNKLQILSQVPYEQIMGKRAKKVYDAAENIAKILDDSEEKLYLNLRIEL